MPIMNQKYSVHCIVSFTLYCTLYTVLYTVCAKSCFGQYFHSCGGDGGCGGVGGGGGVGGCGGCDSGGAVGVTVVVTAFERGQL